MRGPSMINAMGAVEREMDQAYLSSQRSGWLCDIDALAGALVGCSSSVGVAVKYSRELPVGR